MTIDLTSKQESFIEILTASILQILNDNDGALNEVIAQWNAMAYATGANPNSNNITDATASAVRPSLNASIVNSAIGAIAAIQSTIAANRGYLEAMRP